MTRRAHLSTPSSAASHCYAAHRRRLSLIVFAESRTGPPTFPDPLATGDHPVAAHPLGLERGIVPGRPSNNIHVNLSWRLLPRIAIYPIDIERDIVSAECGAHRA